MSYGRNMCGLSQCDVHPFKVTNIYTLNGELAFKDPSVLLLLLFYTRLKAVFSRREDVSKDLNTKRPFSMNNRERRSHGRGLYSTQDTSRVGTARVK